MDMQVIIQQMAILFILLALGYVAGKSKVLSADTGRAMSKIVLHILIPCTILNSAMSGNISITGREALIFLIISLLSFLVAHIVAIPATRALGGDKSNHGLYGYMAAYGNVAFVGFPATYAIFGASSAFYVTLYNIPYAVLAFSAGIIMISKSRENVKMKAVLNPAFICAIIAILIYFTGYKTPMIIMETVKTIGGATTPSSLIVIGASLAQIPIKSVVLEWRLYPVTILKLIVIPVIIWLVFKPFITSELMLGVLVILSGMPTAATAAMVALEYGGNGRIASSGVFMTTLLSCASVPMLAYLLLK